MSNSELVENSLLLNPSIKVPHIIKYMGSKSSILDFLIESISEIYEGEVICDLFSGTSVLSGALGRSTTMFSNDIQEYSSVFSKTYLADYEWENYPKLSENIISKAENYVDKVKNLYPNLNFDYDSNLSLEDFNGIENEQQELIYQDFDNIEYHLFIKNYSGTYWSYDQCLCIDAIRKVAEEYRDENVYYIILSSLMFAMAYNAQSTGHYAQYRDANNTASMSDIIIYRRKKIIPYFKKKMKELISFTGRNNFNHQVSTLDYRECLEILPENSIIYADPPYTFVHYSRFYHALETLVKYDYPNVLYKGRYRNDRHQSPFCKKTEVVGAFSDMFRMIAEKNSKLVLSYSNTGMMSLDTILDLANKIFGSKYEIYTKNLDYRHSTMGRSEDKSREVKEFLVIVKPV